ncbi:hypothetical protein DFH07DRAFT_785802 [Mycena maculata]|uniref:Uncharacterized protein n=1 Tax=Mycena maculata TaxID=230809 RepID=A0AAD7MFL8_9AGAR|nr:hypothetical protein DFH07DRAFT_785802 [Mycena maculata]
MDQPERRYNPADLARLKRPELVAIVQQQLDKWPKEILGNADSLFTTHKPAERPVSPIHDNRLPPPLSTLPPPSPSPAPAELPVSGTIGIFSPPFPVDVRGSYFILVPLEHPPIICPQSPISEHRSVLLLIEDTRSNEKVSQHVRVSVIKTQGTPDEWQTSSHEIVDELQASIAAFDGPARIGISDPENPGYTVFLGTITGPDYQANDARSSPVLVAIPQSGTLKLIVSHIGGAAKQIQSKSPPDSLAASKGDLSAKIEIPSQVSPNKKQKSATKLTEKELAWITEKAQSTPGFEEFKLKQNQRLSNSERIKYWQFVAAFSTAYYKAHWPLGIELSGGKTVKKNAALGMETTMLTLALNMARIVGIYYDGPHRSPEVMARIDSGSDSGSESLVNFLVQWEKDHLLSTSSF